MRGRNSKLIPITDAWEWQIHGECSDMGSSVFYSPPGERGKAKKDREAYAVSICARCVVREACATFALETDQEYGVWGGLTEADRDQLQGRSRRKQSQQPQEAQELSVVPQPQELLRDSKVLPIC